MPVKRTVADAILDQLASWGVKRIYGYAGDAILTFLDAINRHPQIEYVQARHESAAAFMASAEAKLTGRVAVCTATSGPGTANLINGLGDAYSDKVPVIAITGQVPTKYIGTGYKQYIDEKILIQPLAKYSALLTDPQPTVELIYRALQTSMVQGTVSHIAVPKDIFTKPCTQEPRPQDSIFAAHKMPDEQGLQRAVQLLRQAKKPMFLIGRGARGKGQMIEKWSEQLGAAITYSLPAKGIISRDFNYLVGGLGLAGSNGASMLLEEADCLLTIGSTWWPERFVPKKISIIQLDGILENLGLQDKISVGIEGCIEKSLSILRDMFEGKPNRRWVEKVKTVREKWINDLEQEVNSDVNPILPQRLVSSVEGNAAADAVIALDVGEHVLWFDKVFQGQQQIPLISGSWRSMGFGLPAALAAKLEFPERQVIALVGDGGLTMSMGEMVTAVERGINVKTVVFNNSSLSMERNRMIVAGISQTGTNLYNPDFKLVAQGCGWEGYQVTEAVQLDNVLKEAFASNKPSLIDVKVSAPIPPHTTL
ncbi:MAG: thiamine pyrophosphate-binding protein [Bacillota bacterium]